MIRAAVADSACATPALRYWRADCHDEAEARYRHDLHASRVAYLSRPVSPPDEVFSEPAEAACEPPAEMATPTQGA